MKKFFNSEELNIVQVSATTMAGKTLLQHAVFYDLDDHIKILLDGGYYYHYPYDFFCKSVQKIILPEQVFFCHTGSMQCQLDDSNWQLGNWTAG